MPDGMRQPEKPVVIPEAYEPLFWRNKPDGTPIRYKIYYGGRGGAKSHSFAIALITEAFSERHLILCTRQYQNSIADSVYRVVEGWVYKLGLAPWFEMTRQSIYCKKTGSEFIFKGLQRNINEIRSLEGVTRCWIEEANSTTLDNWLILDPTIRAPGSQIWISYNPEMENDALHKKFVVDEPPNNAIVRKVTFRDNPWFEYDTELPPIRDYMLKHDPDNYDWVWEGNIRRFSDAMVFRGKLHFEAIEEVPAKTRFYYGLDFGFADSPTCLLRMWIRPSIEGAGEDLMIDREAYGYHIELDELEGFFDAKMPEVKGTWPIIADSEAAGTISFLARRGFVVRPTEKWPGCEEDGIRHIRAFRRIIIDQTRCPGAASDFRLYSYKTDPKLVDDKGKPVILPILQDKNDHAPDACIMAGQLVETGRGAIPIEDIVPGDMVLTRKGLRCVKNAWSVGIKPIWRLTAGDRTLYATGDHRIALTNGYFTRLDALRYADCIVALQESPTRASKPWMAAPVLTVEDVGFNAPVYDLEVEGEHEFLANGILVHNCRYGLNDMIQKRGGLAVWERLVKPHR